jgi:ABC-2 type transport system permease protein
MPIHDQGYRRYLGKRAPHGRTWWVIARAAIMNLLRTRQFIGLLLFAWAPFVVRAVQIYVASNFQQASFLAATHETYHEFLEQQSIWVFLMTVWVGARLIADDRRANALQIYLSKPLTRIEYVAGKLVALLVFLLGVTWLPAMLLLLLQIMFQGSFAFIRGNLFLFPAITLFSLIQVFTAAFTVLALSSLSKSRRFVGIMYAGLIFFTTAMYNMLRAMTASTSWAWISPLDCLDIVGRAIFRMRPTYALPVPLALLAIVVLIAGSIFILERRVRGVEVVT